MPAFDEQDYTKSFQWGIWKRLMPVMRPYRRDFAGMFAFNLITAAIDVVLPLFQRYAISNYIEAGTLSGLLPYTLCYFGVILLPGPVRCGLCAQLHEDRDVRRARHAREPLHAPADAVVLVL